MALTVPPPPVVPVHPDGAQCLDCKHFTRCQWLLSYDGTETSCDWTPSKFVHRGFVRLPREKVEMP